MIESKVCIMSLGWKKISANLVLYLGFPFSQLLLSFCSFSNTFFSSFKFVRVFVCFATVWNFINGECSCCGEGKNIKMLRVEFSKSLFCTFADLLFQSWVYNTSTVHWSAHTGANLRVRWYLAALAWKCETSETDWKMLQISLREQQRFLSCSLLNNHPHVFIPSHFYWHNAFLYHLAIISFWIYWYSDCKFIIK